MKLISLLSFFVLSGPCLPLKGISSYCKLPVNIGSCNSKCQEAKIRFFYNSTAGSCEPFNYKGCKGNRNNFLTWKMCQDNCKGSKTYNLCGLSPERGPCKAKITRYFYDSRLKNCIPFTYGGCKGNRNNFEKKMSCLRVCKYRRTNS